MKKAGWILIIVSVVSLLATACGAHKGCEAYSDNNEVVQKDDKA